MNRGLLIRFCSHRYEKDHRGAVREASRCSARRVAAPVHFPGMWAEVRRADVLCSREPRSRSWRNAVLCCPASADVLRALERVAGNLRFLNLGGCRLLSGVDMAQIMGVVHASCGDAQTTVDVSGCTDEARLSAVAECALPLNWGCFPLPSCCIACAPSGGHSAVSQSRRRFCPRAWGAQHR